MSFCGFSDQLVSGIARFFGAATLHRDRLDANGAKN
jgi:hypothetical protein